jgi:hypothetical protein
MQIDRHANDRDVRHDECVHHELPPGKAQQTVGKEIKQGIQQGNLPVERETRGTRKVTRVKKVKAYSGIGRHSTGSVPSVCNK